MYIEDIDYDMYIKKLDTKRYKMNLTKVVKESYETMDEMLADEILTNEDKIRTLNQFIATVETAISRMILRSNELIKCNDLLTTLREKILELKEEKDV